MPGRTRDPGPRPGICGRTRPHGVCMASTAISPELESRPTVATPPPEHKEGGYSAENITVLEGLAAVRLRPAMYIGSTGEMGLHHLVYEVVDNSVDEALGGYATKIDVTIHVDNSITVVDDGRGIPVDDMVTNGEKMPAVQVVLTVLHAGGKFDASNYKVSGGLHGVGVSCVNALSQEFNVEIWRDGYTWEMDFSCGDPVSELRKAGTSKRRGTKIHFLPATSMPPAPRASKLRSPTSAPPTPRRAKPAAPSSSTSAGLPSL